MEQAILGADLAILKKRENFARRFLIMPQNIVLLIAPPSAFSWKQIVLRPTDIPYILICRGSESSFRITKRI